MNVTALPTIQTMPEPAVDALLAAVDDAIAALTTQLIELAEERFTYYVELHRRTGQVVEMPNEEAWLEHVSFGNPKYAITTAGLVQVSYARDPRTGEPYVDSRLEKDGNPTVPEGWWHYRIVHDVADFLEPF